MKTKGFNKKLIFKKQTISNLENKQLDDVQGGRPPTSVWLSVCVTVCDTDCGPCPTDPQWETCESGDPCPC